MYNAWYTVGAQEVRGDDGGDNDGDSGGEDADEGMMAVKTNRG